MYKEDTLCNLIITAHLASWTLVVKCTGSAAAEWLAPQSLYTPTCSRVSGESALWFGLCHYYSSCMY